MDWWRLIIGTLSMLVLWQGVRLLDGTVTHVRARFGLGAAWGTAILGFAAIFGAAGLIALIGFLVERALT